MSVPDIKNTSLLSNLAHIELLHNKMRITFIEMAAPLWTLISGLFGKYRGGISRAVFPGISRPVQYPPGNTFYYNYSIIFHVNRKL